VFHSFFVVWVCFSTCALRDLCCFLVCIYCASSVVVTLRLAFGVGAGECSVKFAARLSQAAGSKLVGRAPFVFIANFNMYVSCACENSFGKFDAEGIERFATHIQSGAKFSFKMQT
jgi:hypothetical protein